MLDERESGDGCATGASGEGDPGFQIVPIGLFFCVELMPVSVFSLNAMHDSGRRHIHPDVNVSFCK